MKKELRNWPCCVLSHLNSAAMPSSPVTATDGTPRKTSSTAGAAVMSAMIPPRTHPRLGCFAPGGNSGRCTSSMARGATADPAPSGPAAGSTATPPRATRPPLAMGHARAIASRRGRLLPNQAPDFIGMSCRSDIASHPTLVAPRLGFHRAPSQSGQAFSRGNAGNVGAGRGAPRRPPRTTHAPAKREADDLTSFHGWHWQLPIQHRRCS